MKVNVRLFGTLGSCRPGYVHEKGMAVEIPDGATVRDLLNYLKISDAKKGVVAVDGRLLRDNAALPDGARVNIFQPVYGG